MNEHRHIWKIDDDKLICTDRSCYTKSDVQTAIANAENEAAKRSRFDVVVGFLRSRELKKDAHEREYAWVCAYSTEAVEIEPKQLGLEI